MLKSDGDLERALSALGSAQTDPPAAQTEAESLLAANTDPDVTATARYALGMAQRTQHKLDEACRVLQQAADEALAGGFETLGGRALLSLSGAEYMAGRFQEAFATAERASGHLAGADLAACKVQLATFLTAQERNVEALEMFDEAIVEFERAGALFRLPLAHMNRALTLVDLGRLADAQAALETAWSLIERDPAQTGFILSHLGWVAAMRGDLVSALRWFEQLDHSDVPGRDDPGWLVDYAYALLESGLIEEAEAAARRSLELAEGKGMRFRRTLPLRTLAECALRSNDPESAIYWSSAAAAALEEMGASPLPARLLEFEARLAGTPSVSDFDRAGDVIAEVEASGRAGEAKAARVELALAAARSGLTGRAEAALPPGATSAGLLRMQAQAWTAVAHIRLAHGNRSGAESGLRAALRRVDQHRAAFGSAELRATASTHGVEAAELGLRMAVESGDSRAMFTWAERTRASAYHRPRVRAVSDDVQGELLAAYRRVIDRIRKEEGAVRALERERARLERRIREHARTLEAGESERSSVPSLPEVRGSLGDGVFVEFLEVDGEVSALVVGPRRSHVVSIRDAGAVEPRLKAMDLAVGKMLGGRDVETAFERFERVLADLDDRVVGPWRNLLGESVVISPVGRLHSVPWSGLPSLRDCTVSVVPSAAAWLRDRPAASGAPLLAAGPDLAHAGPEVQALRTRWRAPNVLAGERASVESVMRGMAGASVAHLVAHGSFRTDNPMFTSLAFADGPLNLYDLEDLNEPPGLVVLSACEVGSSVVRIGDELMGMAATFLELGSGAVIAPLYPVSDEATKRVMEETHAALAAGASPAAALREARRLDDPTDRLAAFSFVSFG